MRYDETMCIAADARDDRERKLRCARCDRWVNLGVVADEDFRRMGKIGVKCGDCVTAAVIDYEEGDYE